MVFSFVSVIWVSWMYRVLKNFPISSYVLAGVSCKVA